jgi:hypothetical protein
MKLTTMVEETVREVIDAVMNVRIYAERFKKDCNMKVAVEAIAFDLAVVSDAKGETTEVLNPDRLTPVEGAANRIRFDVKVDMWGFESRR